MLDLAAIYTHQNKLHTKENRKEIASNMYDTTIELCTPKLYLQRNREKSNVSPQKIMLKKRRIYNSNKRTQTKMPKFWI